MVRIRVLLPIIGIGCLVMSPDIGSGASAIGNATMRVMKSLSIQPLTDLTFASATSGAQSQTIVPGEPGGASFSIGGDANATYTVRLPERAVMQKMGAEKDAPIAITTFTSLPASSGKLSSTGEQVLHVGATREALAADQEEGTYMGSFTIEVIY